MPPGCGASWRGSRRIPQISQGCEWPAGAHTAGTDVGAKKKAAAGWAAKKTDPPLRSCFLNGESRLYHEHDQLMKTSYIAPLPLRHASRVPRSLGARNRSSSRPGLVHPTTLATGTAWSHGRAHTTCRHLACRGQLAAEAAAAAERMKISMAAKRFSARSEAAEEVEVRSRCSRAPSPPSRAWSYRTRCSLRMGQQIQRGVSTRGGKA